MATNSKPSNSAERPEFAVTLGLLPPYAIEDVKRAYLEKVKDTHPDHGGDRAEFARIQHAYEQALEYLRFRSDRREWIAARMEEYLEIVALLEQLRAWGAKVETVMPDWVQRSFGDFASLTESIVAIEFEGQENVGELVELLVREQAVLPALRRLSLAGCPVNDALAFQLRVFKRISQLDLSRTAITERALALVEWLPALVDFKIDGTAVGWWPRFRLRRQLKRRRAAAIDPVLHPVNVR